MDIDKIIHHINFGSTGNVCVRRGVLAGDLNEIVQSIYITNVDDNSYLIEVEFEPTGMVGQGDGWIWHTSEMTIAEIVFILENYFHEKISEWTIISIDSFSEQSNYPPSKSIGNIQDILFEDKYDCGHVLLPFLYNYGHWRKKPYTYNKKHGLL